MDQLENSDIILGVLYATGAILLLITSYLLFNKRAKRGALEHVDEVTLSTSRYDVYTQPTQFLIELTAADHVLLSIFKKEDESAVNVLIDSDLPKGENVVDFNPLDFEEGIYYLSLKTSNSAILRKITITRP